MFHTRTHSRQQKVKGWLGANTGFARNATRITKSCYAKIEQNDKMLDI